MGLQHEYVRLQLLAHFVHRGRPFCLLPINRQLVLQWTCVSLCETMELMADCARRNDRRHMLILARSLLDIAVSLVLVVLDDELMKDALGYAAQRTARSMDRREFKVGGFSVAEEWLGDRSVAEEGMVRDAVAKFTRRSGKPRISWNDLTILQRLEWLEARVNPSDFVAFFGYHAAVYQDASEVVHGSFAGVLLSKGADRLFLDAFAGRAGSGPGVSAGADDRKALLFLSVELVQSAMRIMAGKEGVVIDNALRAIDDAARIVCPIER